MEEKEDIKKENIENEPETVKVRIGTVGNYVLAIFVVLIIGTGSLTYYLIHSAKEDYDKQYNEIISNLPIANITNTEAEENVDTLANIIDSALSDVTNQTNTNTTVATEATNTRKILNEELVVLYNGLVLDTHTMDEVTLKYIDSTADASDKYVITYYNNEN